MFEQLSVSQWVAVVSTLLLLVSEALPFAATIKSNGIFQAILAVLKIIKVK